MSKGKYFECRKEIRTLSPVDHHGHSEVKLPRLRVRRRADGVEPRLQEGELGQQGRRVDLHAGELLQDLQQVGIATVLPFLVLMGILRRKGCKVRRSGFGK